jgi:hypothetical protein
MVPVETGGALQIDQSILDRAFHENVLVEVHGASHLAPGNMQSHGQASPTRFPAKQDVAMPPIVSSRNRTFR